MFIQTDKEGRILSMMEKTIIDENGEEVEQDTTGYFEFDFPEGFDLSDFHEYILQDGKLIYSISEEERLSQIFDLENLLHETDYISAKMTDRLAACTTTEEILAVNLEFQTEYGETLAKRQLWRDKINELKKGE